MKMGILSLIVRVFAIVRWASFGRAWTQFDLFYMTMKIDLSMIFVMRRFTFLVSWLFGLLYIVYCSSCTIFIMLLLVNFDSVLLRKRFVISHDYKTMHFDVSVPLSNFLWSCATEKSSWKIKKKYKSCIKIIAVV